MRTRNSGHTLPELMIVMAIMGILLIISQRTVTYGYEFYRSTEESLRLQREGLLALTWLSRDAALSHHRSIEVDMDDPMTEKGAPAWREDDITIPLPQDLNGNSHANDKGALTWRSIAAYQVDPTTHYLMRYVGDTANAGPTVYLTGDSPPNDYISNIELVTAPPNVAAISAWSDVNRRVAAHNVIEFKTDKRVDTLDVELTIFLKGQANKDNSLTLKTTIFPRN